MRIFYYNSKVNINKLDEKFVVWELMRGNKFINDELHFPFVVSDDVPEDARLFCLMNNPFEHYSSEQYLITEILGGTIESRYALFYK
jgi:hypothetical protein